MTIYIVIALATLGSAMLGTLLNSWFIGRFFNETKKEKVVINNGKTVCVFTIINVSNKAAVGYNLPIMPRIGETIEDKNLDCIKDNFDEFNVWKIEGITYGGAFDVNGNHYYKTFVYVRNVAF